MHEEEILGKAYDSQLMRRLLAYLKPYKTQVILNVFLLLLGAVVHLASPLLYKIGIDRYIEQGDLEGLTWIGLAFLGLLIVEFGMQFSETYLIQWIGQRAMYDMRLAIFSHIQRLPISFFDRNPVGRVVTRVTTDVQSLHQMLSSGAVAIFGDVFRLTGIVIFLLVLNWKLALITFSVLPLLFYGTFLFRKKVRDVYRMIRIRIARINTYLQENITGMSVVQIFNREQKNFETFDKLNYDHLEAFLKTILYYALFYPAVRLISAIAVALILWYGGRNILSGMLTFGALVAFIQYAEMFFRPIMDLSEKYNIMQSAMASSERIFKLVDEPTEPAFAQNGHSNHRLLRGEIEFRNVWFAYKDDDYVLKDVSFKVRSGEIVAFVGATGSGKTTILNLLFRFYDVQRGQILIDGFDINTLDPTVLRQNMGMVQQDVFIFDGTIEANIRLGNAWISDRQVMDAARNVNADKFIKNLPSTYKQPVKERGKSLSAGQRQLLAFARALAFDPSILILDEATSSVDTETELLIQDALQRLMQDRTNLVVAHRLSTIQNADRILVLHKGEIRESGTHQELLALEGIYHRLHRLQYDYPDEKKVA
jgi:ATP-binding cassette subfamily B protein